MVLQLLESQDFKLRTMLVTNSKNAIYTKLKNVTGIVVQKGMARRDQTDVFTLSTFRNSFSEILETYDPKQSPENKNSLDQIIILGSIAKEHMPKITVAKESYYANKGTSEVPSLIFAVNNYQQQNDQNMSLTGEEGLSSHFIATEYIKNIGQSNFGGSLMKVKRVVSKKQAESSLRNTTINMHTKQIIPLSFAATHLSNNATRINDNLLRVVGLNATFFEDFKDTNGKSYLHSPEGRKTLNDFFFTKYVVNECKNIWIMSESMEQQMDKTDVDNDSTLDPYDFDDLEL
jgi:hypothetical protein